MQHGASTGVSCHHRGECFCNMLQEAWFDAAHLHAGSRGAAGGARQGAGCVHVQQAAERAAGAVQLRGHGRHYGCRALRPRVQPAGCQARAGRVIAGRQVNPGSSRPGCCNQGLACRGSGKGHPDCHGTAGEHLAFSLCRLQSRVQPAGGQARTGRVLAGRQARHFWCTWHQ